jgi:tetratricopeptide (TPR) repeat protein
MKFSPRFFAVAITIITIASGVAYAQMEYGSQKGTVTDPDGNPIEGVEVRAGSDMVKSDDKGGFVFRRIAARIHDFTFTKEGYHPYSVRKQVAAIMNNRPLNVVLQPATVPVGQQVNQLVQEGQELIRQGKTRDALAKFDEALGLDAESVPANYLAGVVKLQLGQFAKAQENLLKVYAKLPEDMGTNIALAHSYFYDRKFEDAQVHYEKVIELNAAQADTYLNLGICYQNMDMIGDSIIVYKKALEMNPDLDEALSRLGIALYEYQENYNEAIPHLEKYIQLQPNGQYVDDVKTVLLKCYLDKGIEMYNGGQEAEAKVIFQKILDLDPDSEDAGKVKILMEGQ